MPLDETPVAVTLTARQLGAATAAVRSTRRKREREMTNHPFTPEPGRLNLTEIKVKLLVDTEAALQAALEPFSRPVEGGNAPGRATLPADANARPARS